MSQKAETIGGVTATYSYTYDPAGRLTEVRKDGAVFGDLPPLRLRHLFLVSVHP